MESLRDLLDIAAICSEYGASPRFWRREIWAKNLTCVRLGRKVLVRRAHLEAYLQQREHPASATVRPPLAP
jgi:hypothetical protein